MEGIGNGNGFKGGGYGADPADFPADPAEHTTRFCLAFSNKAAGFYANHHPGLLFFHNNTGYDNHPNFNMLGMNASGGDITVGEYRNNVAFGGTLFSNRNAADEASNSWTIDGLMVTEADFQSVATTGMDAARGSDGSLPVLPNFRLAEASDLIDQGADLGLPFAGAAPDLGAFEVGLEPPVVSGGSAGAPGLAGAPAGGGGSAGKSGGGSNSVGGLPASGGAVDLGGSTGGGVVPPTAGAPVTSPGNGNGADGASTSSGCACRLERRPTRDVVALGVAILLLATRRSRRRAV
jgi:hypothetical protein